jgi:hypothetical protein
MELYTYALREVLTEEELKEVYENLARYLESVLRIYERISEDPEAYSKMKKLIAERII